MDTKRLILAFATVLMTLMTVGCGGGGDSAQPEPPSPIDPPLGSIDLPRGPKLEVLTGKISVDFDNCQSADGAADEAQFSHLQRITVYTDAVYLAETGEGCANVSYDIDLIPNNLRPAIRKLSGGTVETAVSLNQFNAFAVGTTYYPVMVRYPSGFHRKESTGEFFVSGYAAASSEWNFALDEREASRYTERSVWNYYIPGLFRFNPANWFSTPHASHNDLIAGKRGEPPAHADGKGHAARFTAPHNLEVDAAGLFYLIDDGRIRTIDSDYNVTMLDHAALGITDTAKALDADHQGNIHVLTQRGGSNYTWHRLADGSRVHFNINLGGVEVPVSPPTLETFTVTGDDMLLGVRIMSSGTGYHNTRLFRVSATGEVTELTGTDTPNTPQDFLDQPSQYLLPPVKHIKYGVDGHLYIVLPQGVLIARDYGAQ
ncbi:MAG: hypothetical protein LBE15_02970 [Burkholderiales bacterium]|jgi:hypothetical protein|nr:hypothetical protein [Burkholderiales bacterium]